MKPKDILTLNITGTSSDGRGIAKSNGKVIFVLGAVEGDTVSAEIYTVHKTYMTAGVIKIETPSPLRNNDACKYSERCGGCPLSHIRYEHQLKIKKQTVTDAFTRLSKINLDGVTVSDTVGMENPIAYRNKMVFPIGETNGVISGGFYSAKSHNIVPLDCCSAGDEINISILNTVLSFMKEHNIKPYNEKSGKGSIRRVFVRTGYNSKQLMIVLCSAKREIKNIEGLVQKLKDLNCGKYVLKSIILNVNRKPNNLVLGSENYVLFGTSAICDTLLGLKFSISPNSFYQVNPVQTEKLYTLALNAAAVTKDDTVLDVYCGIGTISLSAAQRAKKVIGVEIVDDAIKDARENAKLNNIENALFYCGAAENTVPAIINSHGKINTVIIDPPRKGSDNITLNSIVKAAPEKIVYVSCNPITLARDVKYLAENGYKLISLTPVDMFPNTSHIESVVLLSRKIPDDIIEINIDLDELDITTAESKATYEEIKAYILNKYHFKVSSLYIAQIKTKYGIKEAINYNISKKGTRVPQCPPDKEKAITDALKYYGII